MRKKSSLICVIIILAVLLTLTGCTNIEKEVNNNLVGIYYNSNWNGREATLTLNKDGTCIYPTGNDNNYKWTVSGEKIIITSIDILESPMQVFMEYEATEEQISKLSEDLKKIEGIDSITFVTKEDAYNTMKEQLGKNEEAIKGVTPDIFSVSFIIKLRDLELNNQVYNEISNLEGVRTVRKSSEENSNIYEYEASIVDDGLILYDHFFKKMN